MINIIVNKNKKLVMNYYIEKDGKFLKVSVSKINKGSLQTAYPVGGFGKL